MRAPREAAVFVHKGDRFLVMRRTLERYWHVVAGVVEAAESYADGPVRELRAGACFRWGLVRCAVRALVVASISSFLIVFPPPRPTAAADFGTSYPGAFGGSAHAVLSTP